MGREYNMYGGEERSIQGGFWWGNLRKQAIWKIQV